MVASSDAFRKTKVAQQRPEILKPDVRVRSSAKHAI
jgi:hypothetical protein